MSLKYKPYRRKGAETPTSYVAYITGVDGKTLTANPWGKRLLDMVRKHGRYNPKLQEGKGWIIQMKDVPAFEKDYRQFQVDYREQKAAKAAHDVSKSTVSTPMPPAAGPSTAAATTTTTTTRTLVSAQGGRA